jgi:methylmalonyl-CoA mutase N-terminal domain/subunit
VARALAELQADAKDPEVNLMATLIRASKARVSVGEVMEALADVFGYYEEPGI